MMKRLALAITLAALAAPGLAQPAPAAKGPPMSAAVKAAQTAVQVCARNGYKVSAAVLDSGGVLKALIAADGAFPMAVSSSQRKAVAVLAYKVPSAELEARVKADPQFAATMEADKTMFARAGAQPIMMGGEMVGAIGVGGAPGGEKDDVCAIAAIKGMK